MRQMKMRELQRLLASESGEAAFMADMARLIRSGQFESAEARLADVLAEGHGPLVAACQMTTPGSVVITGWDHLAEALESQEEATVTAISITLWNEVDIPLERQPAYEPGLDLRFHSDEAFPFSTSDSATILAECTSIFTPWQERCEDIEAYIEIEGLAALNAAILNHPLRVFIRPDDGSPCPEAPADYVTFLVGSWLRVLRFHQAVTHILATQGLPCTVPVILGSHNIRPYVGAVHYPVQREQAIRQELAELTINMARTRPAKADALSGTAIRRLVQEEAAETSPARRPSFFARLFRRGDKKAA